MNGSTSFECTAFMYSAQRLSSPAGNRRRSRLLNVGCNEGLARMQHLDELKRGILRSPEQGKDLQRCEASGQIELPRFSIRSALARVRNGLDLEVLDAL